MDHPAHVHFYKNFIWEMQNRGHNIKIMASKKDITLNLLNAYSFEYDQISSQKNKGYARIKDQLVFEYNSFKIARSFHPDFITGIGGTTAAHLSKLLHSKSIIFTDNFLPYDKYITHPWADIITTPTTFSTDLGAKQIKVDSFKELAYLHPDLFSPDPKVFELIGISKNEKFAIVRFVSLGAVHDVGISGFDTDAKIRLVNNLLKYVKVFISAEGEIPTELKKYVIKFPLEKIHDAMYFADLVVTDSQTMTTEAAVLGTPAVRCNSWVGSKSEMLNFIELEQKYNLIYNFQIPDLAIKKCVELLSNPDTNTLFKKKREYLLSDKINFTNFFVWLFENFGKYKMKTRQDFYSKYKNSVNKI